MTRTTKDAYSRRKFLAGALGLGATATFLGNRYDLPDLPQPTPVVAVAKDASAIPGLTTKAAATSYNNAYEFGTRKTDPGRNGHLLDREAWTVQIEGTENDGTYDVEKLMGMPFKFLEERTYRMRCVERWSMVIPWNGRPLASIIESLQPLGSAKYVAFESVVQTGLPGQDSVFTTIDWPYVEALTMEEAMNDLTFATFGAYGDQDLPQNGMPLKINVPWKYGFKSPKFVSKIRFTDEKPPVTWNEVSAREYGWYSNVYPDVLHPRWSQKTETRIWSPGETDTLDTEIYNGYGEQVAHMYPGDKLQYR